jgi:hypothetical protein
MGPGFTAKLTRYRRLGAEGRFDYGRPDGLKSARIEVQIPTMKTRLPIVLSAVLLVAAILLVFRGDLHARDPQHLNRLAEPTTECGFWGSMEEGMSCR